MINLSFIRSTGRKTFLVAAVKPGSGYPPGEAPDKYLQEVGGCGHFGLAVKSVNLAGARGS